MGGAIVRAAGAAPPEDRAIDTSRVPARDEKRRASPIYPAPIEQRGSIEIEKAWAAYQAALEAWRRASQKVPANQP